jgi:hypothetical protein
MRPRLLGAILTTALVHVPSAWGGEIRSAVSKVPSDLQTPLGPQSIDVRKFTSIACYDVRDGTLQDCGFDMRITGLTPPASDVANNGGHNHTSPPHPVGELTIIEPIQAGPSDFLVGQTAFDVFIISHEIPDVSGKIDTLLNLRVPTVPPGWRTVSPESCDGGGTSWCFRTTIDVGVSGLTSLPGGSPFYIKVRGGAPQHEDSVAYFGTADAISNLTAIAETYNQLSNILLSVNDMSLLKGGLFDKESNYSAPHKWHRVGQSADINKKAQGDCRVAAYDLKLAVALVMSTEAESFLPKRTFPSMGRFLCEANGNIHIDFDVVPPPPPSPFQ